MKLKSYFSGTVEAAMELARKELGDDALLVNARPATPETRHLGAYEVVFGALPAQAGEQAEKPAVPQANDTSQRLSQEVAEMKRELERLARCLNGASTLAPAPIPSHPELYQRLIANEFDSKLATAIVQGRPLQEIFEVDATIGRDGAQRRVIALIGPPGVGKTTTLVKLAARYGLATRRPSHIISTDVFRIAAADQLRSLASILGIGCDVVETPLALAQALEEHRSKEIVLIDTPGLARGEMEDGADLARLFATHREIDVHLVLPASMKSADMAWVIDQYEIFKPRKLLFTRLDETHTYGAIVSESARRDLPISFLCTGQQIPDDIEPATKERLMQLALGDSTNQDVARPGGAAAAAGAGA
jgi:flagellar biosynthesis protein FlhF